MKMMKKWCSWVILAVFFLNSVIAPAQAQLVLPVAGARLALSQSFTPPLIRGIKVDPADPLSFQFLMDQGDAPMTDDARQAEYERLIKYFLASLAICKGSSERAQL